MDEQRSKPRRETLECARREHVAREKRDNEVLARIVATLFADWDERYPAFYGRSETRSGS
jgi:hypothetical protein